MKLSELIVAIGDDNVHFQNLDKDIVRLSTKDGHTEITFGTRAKTTINGTEDIGMVVWLPRNKVSELKDKI